MDLTRLFEALGTTGSVIMCVSAIPQIVKIYRTRCARGLSIIYLAVLMTGMSLIMLYALYVRDVVFIFGNGTALLLTGILVGLCFRYRNEKNER